MTYQRKPIETVKDDDQIRLNNTCISGKMYKYLCAKADRNKRGYTNYSSFLIEELLQKYAERNPEPNDLIGNWKNQAEVTEKTLKTEK